jgi:hypothetical protein
MNHENIILWRNILLRSFVIGLLFGLLLLGATVAFWREAAGWVAYLFQVDQRALGRIMLQFFTNVRLVVVFLFIVPGLALHWTAKRMGQPAK